jgi:hypothetical protein
MQRGLKAASQPQGEAQAKTKKATQTSHSKK